MHYQGGLMHVRTLFAGLFLKRVLPLLGGAALAAATFSTPLSAKFNNQPDATWMTNGFVRAVIRVGDVVYIGGRFTAVRACAPGTSCAGAFAVNNVAAFDANSGVAIRSFRPSV